MRYTLTFDIVITKTINPKVAVNIMTHVVISKRWIIPNVKFHSTIACVNKPISEVLGRRSMLGFEKNLSDYSYIHLGAFFFYFIKLSTYVA